MSEQTQEKVIVESHEKYNSCISDSISRTINTNNRGPRGSVEVKVINKKTGEIEQIEKCNLVVYIGREWLISRALNVTNETTECGLPDEFICWLGIGNGGTVEGEPLVPIAPTSLDADLQSSVMINDSKAAYADYRYDPTPGYYKAPLDTVTFKRDPYNSDKYLICTILGVIDIDDAVGEDINEAGLFTANSSEGSSQGPFHLYARITFGTIQKSPERQLVFNWNLYF